MWTVTRRQGGSVAVGPAATPGRWITTTYDVEDNVGWSREWPELPEMAAWVAAWQSGRVGIV